jgi:hypothetical protein
MPLTTIIQSYIVFAPVEIEGEGKERGRKKKKYFSIVCPGNTNWRGRLSTVDLLIKVTGFEKSKNNVW